MRAENVNLELLHDNERLTALVMSQQRTISRLTAALAQLGAVADEEKSSSGLLEEDT